MEVFVDQRVVKSSVGEVDEAVRYTNEQWHAEEQVGPAVFLDVVVELPVAPVCVCVCVCVRAAHGWEVRRSLHRARRGQNPRHSLCVLQATATNDSHFCWRFCRVCPMSQPR